MKTRILILFITLHALSSFCQKSAQFPKTFTAENNTIYWENIYQLNSGEKIEDLNQNLKLNITTTGTGVVEENLCKCNSGSSFINQSFKFNYKIETKEGKYKVLVTNIIFRNGPELYANRIQTDKDIFTFEYYSLDKEGNFKKTFQTKKNLTCLNDYFTNLFKIRSSTNKDW